MKQETVISVYPYLSGQKADILWLNSQDFTALFIVKIQDFCVIPSQILPYPFAGIFILFLSL